MDEKRPDPDFLLARFQTERSTQKRGRLKVFLGMCAGVGKTYSMLEAAQSLRKEGLSPLIGIVETHGRPETETLLDGLEILPRRILEHRNIQLQEFDLDEALRRKPNLILVDELAHANAPGSRHDKRWLDVQELLDAGIHVFTTLNIQHLESLNDVVAQITHVRMRETVPDAALEQAAEIVLIDLPPGELLERLRDGKVYTPEQSEHAAANFFRPANLTALRELALRFLASRVNAQVQIFRQSEGIQPIWPTAERLLVGVGPSPSSPRLIRAAKRMASTLGAEWIALAVETPTLLHAPPIVRERIAQHLRLAERLGARILIASGNQVADEILKTARQNNVTKIVVGKPVLPVWRRRLTPTLVDDLIRRSDDIDVYVIRGEGDSDKHTHPPPLQPSQRRRRSWIDASLCLIVSNIVAWLLSPVLHLSDLSMIYLAGIVILATRASRTSTLLTAILAVLSFNFIFIPPRFTFYVNSPQYWLTFLVMLLVAAVISTISTRLRDQRDLARRIEQRTAALHRLGQSLTGIRNPSELAQIAAREIADVFRTQVAVYLPDKDNRLSINGAAPGLSSNPEKELAVAQWVFDNARTAGPGADALNSSPSFFVPLPGTDRTLGAIAVSLPTDQTLLYPDQIQLLESMTRQTGMALELERLSEERRQAEVRAQNERFQSSILSSVSHDLRTPLSSILGSATSLLETPERLSTETRRELLQMIADEADHLNQLIGNVLDMTRLEGAPIRLHQIPLPIEEIVGSTLNAMNRRLGNRTIKTSIPDNLPFIFVDEILLQQVLVNLLENALKYTPPDTIIEINAMNDDTNPIDDDPSTVRLINVEVADHGPGLAPGEEEKIFEKFVRGSASPNHSGAGLGLAISRAIIQAHGGQLTARNRPGGGGAIFRFTLPTANLAPPPEEDPATPPSGELPT